MEENLYFSLLLTFFLLVPLLKRGLLRARDSHAGAPFHLLLPFRPWYVWLVHAQHCRQTAKLMPFQQAWFVTHCCGGGLSLGNTSIRTSMGGQTRLWCGQSSPPPSIHMKGNAWPFQAAEPRDMAAGSGRGCTGPSRLGGAGWASRVPGESRQ